MNYSDEDINKFLELAQEVGITRSMRELGYPKSWSTANRWAELRGVKVDVDEIMQKASLTAGIYKTEEILVIAREGFNRANQHLVEKRDLSADDQKKLAEALQKHYNVWASAQGKAASITETRTGEAGSDFDAHLQDLINTEKARNQLKKESSSD